MPVHQIVAVVLYRLCWVCKTFPWKMPLCGAILYAHIVMVRNDADAMIAAIHIRAIAIFNKAIILFLLNE